MIISFILHVNTLYIFEFIRHLENETRDIEIFFWSTWKWWNFHCIFSNSFCTYEMKHYERLIQFEIQDFLRSTWNCLIFYIHKRTQIFDPRRCKHQYGSKRMIKTYLILFKVYQEKSICCFLFPPSNFHNITSGSKLLIFRYLYKLDQNEHEFENFYFSNAFTKWIKMSMLSIPFTINICFIYLDTF